MSLLRNASHDAGWLRRHAAATRITGLSAVCAVCSLFVRCTAYTTILFYTTIPFNKLLTAVSLRGIGEQRMYSHSHLH